MAYDRRNDFRRKRIGVEDFPVDRKGRRLFPSLEELERWESLCGPFARKGSFTRTVTIPASDCGRFPARKDRERVFWGSK